MEEYMPKVDPFGKVKPGTFNHTTVQKKLISIDQPKTSFSTQITKNDVESDTTNYSFKSIERKRLFDQNEKNISTSTYTDSQPLKSTKIDAKVYLEKVFLKFI